MKTNLSAVKMSKRARKALDAQARGDWNGVVPVTRVVPDKKGLRPPPDAPRGSGAAAVGRISAAKKLRTRESSARPRPKSHSSRKL